MKLSILIDKNKEERIDIIAHEMSSKILKIKGMFEDIALINCYKEDVIKKVNLFDVVAIFTNNNKVYVSTKDEEYISKLRLYDFEEIIDDSFIKINKGCLINIHEIKEFGISFNAQLKVIMTNGYVDYVSRRELKEVKRRLCLWKNMVMNL